jgi:hypothetical protein
MEIHDPHAFITRDLDTCETTEPVNDLIPVLSMKDERWFTVCMLTGRSQRLEDLDPEDLSAVREAISSHLFSALLLGHCHQIAESSEEPSKAEALLARADYARRFGARAIEVAEQSVAEVGFTADDIGRAYNLMDAQDPVAHVPVTRVSDLQKADEVRA